MMYLFLNHLSVATFNEAFDLVKQSIIQTVFEELRVQITDENLCNIQMPIELTQTRKEAPNLMRHVCGLSPPIPHITYTHETRFSHMVGSHLKTNFDGWCNLQCDRMCNIIEMSIVVHMSPELTFGFVQEVAKFQVDLIMEEIRTWCCIDMDMYYDIATRACMSHCNVDSVLDISPTWTSCEYKDFGEFKTLAEQNNSEYMDCISCCVKDAFKADDDKKIFSAVLECGTTHMMTMTNNTNFQWCFERNMAIYIRITSCWRIMLPMMIKLLQDGLLTESAAAEALTSMLHEEVAIWHGLKNIPGVYDFIHEKRLVSCVAHTPVTFTLQKQANLPRTACTDVLIKRDFMALASSTLVIFSNTQVKKLQEAIMMATHRRLGNESLLGDIEPHLLEKFARQWFQSMFPCCETS